MEKLTIYYLLLTCFVSDTFCLKLLLIFPFGAKSHYTQGNQLGRGLANAGHEVTMVSAFSDPNPPKNYREIVLPELAEILTNENTSSKPNMFEREDTSPFLNLAFIGSMITAKTDTFFNHSKVQALLKSKEHFDAVIIEQFFNDAMKVLAYHFKAHLILLNLVGPNRWVNNLIGNPEPPSYVPDVLLNFSGDMNFFQRFYNFIFGFVSDLHLYLYIYPKQNAIIKKYFPNAPHINELLYNVSLVLSNSHESVNQPVPHVPNIVNIGGFHVNPPKELPKDLKDFMDNAKNGVIYFSLGSFLMPSEIPKAKMDAILKVLGSRKENVLLKWDKDFLENKPNNVLISKWFPQQAILGHPNCKLFITHGGLLSTIETVYLGTPVLAIPIAGDQKLNAARAASLGYGKYLPFSQVSEYTFSQTLNELLENTSYQENAKHRSKLMHDRPIKPIDLAVYWIEYIVRHKGAPHLRVGGINSPLYKYYMLDIFGLLLGSLLLVVYLLSKLFTSIKWSRFRQTASVKSKKKQM